MKKLKQRTTAKATKVKRYDNRTKQVQDNRNFQTNQARVFKKCEGKEEIKTPPDAEDVTAFWKGIRSAKQKRRCYREKQNTVKIFKDDVKIKSKSMPDWEGAESDEIQCFWLKSFTAVH